MDISDIKKSVIFHIGDIFELRKKLIEKSEIEKLHHKSLQVTVTPTANIPCAILDNKLIWYGTVNLLAKVRTEEHVIRMNDAQLADELLGMVLKDKKH